MQAQKLSWPDFYSAAANLRFQYPNVLRAHVDALKSQCKSPRFRASMEPILITVAGSPPRRVLCVRGVLVQYGNGIPDVELVITFNEGFPNAYPVFTMESPRPPYKFANHPNVDGRGMCYLPSISNWNPRASTLVLCVDELLSCVVSKPIFEGGSGGGTMANHPIAPPTGGRPAGSSAPTAPSGPNDEAIVPISVEQALQEAARGDPQRAQRIQAQICSIRDKCRQFTPHIARVNGMRLLVIKVELAIPERPLPVNCIVTFPPGFPDAFPLLAVEAPPTGWRLVNTPQVDDQGKCYLPSVSRWDAFRSDIVASLSELKECCAQQIRSCKCPRSSPHPPRFSHGPPRPRTPRPQLPLEGSLVRACFWAAPAAAAAHHRPNPHGIPLPAQSLLRRRARRPRDRQLEVPKCPTPSWRRSTGKLRKPKLAAIAPPPRHPPRVHRSGSSHHRHRSVVPRLLRRHPSPRLRRKSRCRTAR